MPHNLGSAELGFRYGLKQDLTAVYSSSRSAKYRFCRRLDLLGVGLRHLGAGLAEPESHLLEQPLALAGAQLHAMASAQMLGKQLAAPQAPCQAEGLQAFAKARSSVCHYRFVSDRGRPDRRPSRKP